MRQIFRSFALILRRLDRRSRLRWLGLVPLALIATALDVLCTLAVVGLLARLGHIAGDAGARVPLLCGAVALLYAVRSAARLLEIHFRHRAAAGSLASLQDQLLREYLAAPYAWHLTRHPADLFKRMTSTAHDVCRNFTSSIFGAVVEGLTALALVVVIALRSPPALLAISALVAGIIGGVLLRAQRRMRAQGHEVFGLESELGRCLSETLQSLKEIRIHGMEAASLQAVQRTTHRIADLQAAQGTLAGIPRLALETLFICGALLMTILGYMVEIPLDKLVPILGGYIYVAARVLPSVSVMIYHIGEVRFNLASALALEADWQELERQLSPPVHLWRGRPAERIEMQEVGFVYPGRQRPAVQGLSFSLERGQCLGIAGASGAGKSTVLDLLLGVLQPTAGQVLVDGRTASGPLYALSRIGYVPQNAYICEGTLLENLAPSIPPRRVDRELLQRAVSAARLEELVQALPAGLDTRIGNGSALLSSGQRQRVALARALYRQPELLVLDEATGALDRPVEEELLQAIFAMRGRLTTILVSHRMSCLRHCDCILLLDEGRLLDHGNYPELVNRSPAFRRLMDPGSASREEALCQLPC